MALREGGRWEAPIMASDEEVAAPTRLRALSAVLALELVWVLVVTASVVFLAAYLGNDADDFPADPVARRLLLVLLPPLAVVIGLALIGARQAVERRAVMPVERLGSMLRLSLWLAAVANGAVVVSILTSLYHARMTWMVVGLVLAVGLTVVAIACVRTAVRAGASKR
jgi:hypothetical protein